MHPCDCIRIGNPDRSERPTLDLFHKLGVFVAGFVIVAEKMERSVNDQMGEGMASEVGTPAYESAMNEVLAANEAGAAEIPMSDPSGYDVLESPWDKAKYWWQTGGKENLDKGMKAYGMVSKALGGGQRAPQYGSAPSMPGYSPARVDMPSGGGSGGFAPRWNAGASAGAPGSSRTALEQERRAAFARGQGFASQGFAFPGRSFVEGGVVEMNKGGFVVPADVVAAIGSGSTDAGLQALSVDPQDRCC